MFRIVKLRESGGKVRDSRVVGYLTRPGTISEALNWIESYPQPFDVGILNVSTGEITNFTAGVTDFNLRRR